VLYFVFAHTRFARPSRHRFKSAAAEFIGERARPICIYATALVGFLSRIRR
jgi:hypothetical protein